MGRWGRRRRGGQSHEAKSGDSRGCSGRSGPWQAAGQSSALQMANRSAQGGGVGGRAGAESASRCRAARSGSCSPPTTLQGSPMPLHDCPRPSPAAAGAQRADVVAIMARMVVPARSGGSGRCRKSRWGRAAGGGHREGWWNSGCGADRRP